MADKLNHVRILDPRVDVNNSRNSTYGIYSSGGQQTFKTFSSQNFDNTQINFVCPPNSRKVFINRRVYIEVKTLTTFTGVSAGAGITLLQARGLDHAPGVSPGTQYYDAPRCSPLSKAFTHISVQLNNDNIATNLSAYSSVYQRYARDVDEENLDLSITPIMSDKSLAYSDLDGLPLNPLAGYGNNTEQTPRGGFTRCKILTNTSTGVADTATVEMTVCEPIWISPFSSGRNQEEVGLIHIQNLQMQITLGGKGSIAAGLTGLAASFWSHSTESQSTFSNVSVKIEAAKAFFNYINPEDSESIPPEITYSYFEPNVYTTQGSDMAPGDIQDFEMNTIMLNSIPNRFYLYCNKQDSTVDWTDTDTFLGLENVSVTFGNRDGILNNMPKTDAYQMAVRNGCNISFDQWEKHVGAVLCVSFGPDIPLSTLQAPGLRDSNTFSLTGRFKNNYDHTIKPVMSVFVIQEGVMVINERSIYRSVGVLTPQDIFEAKTDGTETAVFRKSSNIYGSGIFQDIGDFFRKNFRPALEAIAPLIPAQYQPAVEAVSQIGKQFGLGLGKVRGGALLEPVALKQLR